MAPTKIMKNIKNQKRRIPMKEATSIVPTSAGPMANTPLSKTNENTNKANNLGNLFILCKKKEKEFK
jgi:hypothetical protein